MFTSGRSEEARASIRQAVRQLESQDTAIEETRAMLAAALLQLGRANMPNEIAEARLHCERSVQIYQELGMRWHTAGALNELGRTLHGAGYYSAALESWEQSLAIFRELGDRRQASAVLGNISAALRYRGNVVEAVEACREAVALARALDIRPILITALTNLGLNLQLLAEHDEAYAALTEALRLAETIGNILRMVGILFWLGNLTADLRRYQESVAYAERGYSLAEDTGNILYAGLFLFHLSRISSAIGNFEEALGQADKGLALYSSIGQRLEEVHLLTARSFALRGLKRTAEARTTTIQVLQTVIENKDGLALVTAISLAALLIGDGDDAQTAAAIWRAFRLLVPGIPKRRLLLDLAGEELTALERTNSADAPLEVFAGDLWQLAERTLEILQAQSENQHDS